MGSDVVKESLAARRKVGIVPQELLYDPFFTVRESLTFQSKYTESTIINSGLIRC